MEKKVFRGGGAFDCPTGIDAEVMRLLPEDENTDELYVGVPSDPVQYSAIITKLLANVRYAIYEYPIFY